MKAIITGAAGGLGKALAHTLGDTLGTDGGTVLAPGREELDVSSPESVKAFMSAAGEVDLLVCNAGLAIDKSLTRMSGEDWSRVMDVNLKGAFMCAREVSRQMVKRRSGHIIFISSFSALHPPSGQANYAAAKAALLGLMKSMAHELGGRNVRVNAIMPGFLETRMTLGLSGEIKQTACDKHVLGRFNTPEAVAGFVSYLHQYLPHTSGQVFNLDSRIL